MVNVYCLLCGQSSEPHNRFYHASTHGLSIDDVILYKVFGRSKSERTIAVIDDNGRCPYCEDYISDIEILSVFNDITELTWYLLKCKDCNSLLLSTSIEEVGIVNMDGDEILHKGATCANCNNSALEGESGKYLCLKYSGQVVIDPAGIRLAEQCEDYEESRDGEKQKR